MHRLVALLATAFVGTTLAVGALDGTAATDTTTRERHDALQRVMAFRYGLTWPARPLGTRRSPVGGAGFP